MRGETPAPSPLTLRELVDEYLAQHVAEANTIPALSHRLKKRLPEGSAWHWHKALRQVLSYAVRAKLTTENVARLVPNPEPKRREVPTFGSWDDLDKLAVELHPARASLPILVAGTGSGRKSGWLSSAVT